jgi:two-component system sensor histidine kinase UhpB
VAFKVEATDHIDLYTESMDLVRFQDDRYMGISEDRLPPGSLVRYKPPSMWEQYQGYIIGISLLCGVEALLIIGLLLQRQKCRRVEQALEASYTQIQSLVGRLLTAQEAERTRIARELHDDITQQLAALSIVLSGLKRRLSSEAAESQQEVVRLQQKTIALSEAIRHLSHDLHPGVLQHAGLVAALKAR